MNAAQTAKYFWEWGRAREHFIGKGMTHAQADAKRHELHRKALGRDKSSKAFTNADLDKVIAVFRAVWDGGNLDAQLAQIDQAENRRAGVIRRIAVLMLHLGAHPGSESAYVRGMSKKLFGDDQYQQLDDVKLAQLEGVIVRRLLQLHSKERVEQIQNDAAEHQAKLAGIVAPQDKGEPF